jgi:hypothetical protein
VKTLYTSFWLVVFFKAWDKQSFVHGTPTWRRWRHVKTLYTSFWLVVFFKAWDKQSFVHGTPTWRRWRHVKTLYTSFCLVVSLRHGINKRTMQPSAQPVVDLPGDPMPSASKGLCLHITSPDWASLLGPISSERQQKHISPCTPRQNNYYWYWCYHIRNEDYTYPLLDQKSFSPKKSSVKNERKKV